MILFLTSCSLNFLPALVSPHLRFRLSLDNLMPLSISVSFDVLLNSVTVNILSAFYCFSTWPDAAFGSSLGWPLLHVALEKLYPAAQSLCSQPQPFQAWPSGGGCTTGGQPSKGKLSPLTAGHSFYLQGILVSRTLLSKVLGNQAEPWPSAQVALNARRHQEQGDLRKPHAPGGEPGRPSSNTASHQGKGPLKCQSAMAAPARTETQGVFALSPLQPGRRLCLP